VSRQQSEPGRATCPRDRSHQDAPSDVTPEEPHPVHIVADDQGVPVLHFFAAAVVVD
jgi:hypothetical protein